MQDEQTPIRVLHVITRMVRGGAQENTLANAVGIHGCGWESALVTGPSLGPEGSLERECEVAGMRLVRVPSLVRELSPLQDVVALRKLVELFLKENPHIVHTHTSKAGILGRIGARLARVPVVIHTPHGHVFHDYGNTMKTRLFITMERICARYADRLIALTETEAREHLELGVGTKRQWLTIHSGIDFGSLDVHRGKKALARRMLQLPENACVIGTVARLVPVKGHTFLTDALARLASKVKETHLILIGDGPLRDALIQQARESGLDVVIHSGSGEPSPSSTRKGIGKPTVHFLGLRRDVPQLLPALDIFALPSLNEGMGRVLVEAMAMELPCVASRVSGIPDVVEEGVTGLLVPSRNSVALAEAIEALLQDPLRAAEMGRRGRGRVVPAFSREKMISKLEGLYQELLLSRGISTRVPITG